MRIPACRPSTAWSTRWPTSNWHRMLFARFLAGEPSPDRAGIGRRRVARRMRGTRARAGGGSLDAGRPLRGVDAAADIPERRPALDVRLAPETRQELERLIESLPADVFTARDSLGWTYQFWQAERKDAVNKSGVKIGADELPAVDAALHRALHGAVPCCTTPSARGARAGSWTRGPSWPRPRRAKRSCATRCAWKRTAATTSRNLRFVREPRDGDETGQPRGSCPATATWPSAPISVVARFSTETVGTTFTTPTTPSGRRGRKRVRPR